MIQLVMKELQYKIQNIFKSEYTDTQIHKTQIHKNTNTEILKYSNTQIHKFTNTQIHKYANTLMHRNTNKKNSHHNFSASAGNKSRTLIEYNIQIQLGQLKAYKYTYGSQLNRQHPTC